MVGRVDWEHTSLKPYVQMMDKHAQGLMREVRNANKGGLSFLSIGPSLLFPDPLVLRSCCHEGYGFLEGRGVIYRLSLAFVEVGPFVVFVVRISPSQLLSNHMITR